MSTVEISTVDKSTVYFSTPPDFLDQIEAHGCKQGQRQARSEVWADRKRQKKSFLKPDENWFWSRQWQVVFWVSLVHSVGNDCRIYGTVFTGFTAVFASNGSDLGIFVSSWLVMGTLALPLKCIFLDFPNVFCSGIFNKSEYFCHRKIFWVRACGPYLYWQYLNIDILNFSEWKLE